MTPQQSQAKSIRSKPLRSVTWKRQIAGTITATILLLIITDRTLTGPIIFPTIIRLTFIPIIIAHITALIITGPTITIPTYIDRIDIGRGGERGTKQSFASVGDREK